ncbi:MAG: hypothetical protein IJE04_05695 [Bacilli bacterium]|nr:hypothetical protein [Bacilli bacterium]
MGFFEKVKNMFTEEIEDDDVKVEQIKKEVTKVAIESPNTKEEVKDEYEFRSEDKINIPVFFDDNDFRDLKLEEKKSEPKKEYKERELYGIKKEEPVVEKKVFKPTPIISPVYGVLDKNYHKEDIVSRNEVRTNRVEKSVNESSIDAIRNKAYGTLEDELENTLFGSNSILFKRDTREDELEIKEVNDDVLTDLTDDISKELDELLIRKERYVDDIEEIDDVEDKLVDEPIDEYEEDLKVEKEDLGDDDLLDFIDSTLYKDGDDE